MHCELLRSTTCHCFVRFCLARAPFCFQGTAITFKFSQGVCWTSLSSGKFGSYNRSKSANRCSAINKSARVVTDPPMGTNRLTCLLFLRWFYFRFDSSHCSVTSSALWILAFPCCRTALLCSFASFMTWLKANLVHVLPTDCFVVVDVGQRCFNLPLCEHFNHYWTWFRIFQVQCMLLLETEPRCKICM